MSIAFLVTTPYQLFHYKWIAEHLDDVVLILEVRGSDFGLTDELALQHIPQATVDHVDQDLLATLDGRYDLIVCQTPILPLAFLDNTLVVAQQYSLAKEAYQYGPWRAHADLNLMYGSYSLDRVQGYCQAVTVGNPLLDPLLKSGAIADRGQFSSTEPPRVLYMPTYGELSSLNQVLPYLDTMDAEVTIKLHHAEDKARLGSLADNVHVVYSDADPVMLLRDHDGVLSDLSGAAFDALYAGRPVVLTGQPNPGSKDYLRLSSDELKYSLLQEVTTAWQPGQDLNEAFHVAAGLVGSDAHKALNERLFTNAGKAGAACAKEILRLLDQGPTPHFGAQQVRNVTRRYVISNRQLRARLERSNQSRNKDIVHTPNRLPRDLYSHARRTLARSQTLRRIIRSVRGYEVPKQDGIYPPMPEQPAERREALCAVLLEYLNGENINIARTTTGTGSSVALLTKDLTRLHRCLSALTKVRHDLNLRVRRGSRIVYSGRLDQLRPAHLAGADWLQLGSMPPTTQAYPFYRDAYLNIYLVDYDTQRNRYIARYDRADRIDWTGFFGARRSERVSVREDQHPASPIDVVYTWVDSGDPSWRAEHLKYSEGERLHSPSANNNERYINRDELKYSLRSVYLLAPFVRHIYIVTADQRPHWLRPDPRISVVPHREIFPDCSALPTFNSHAIEACIHRIPGLSENFLYFNDDVFLGRETTEEDFFSVNGLARVRFSPSQFIYEGRPEPDAIPTDWAAYNSIELIRREFSMSFDRRVKHVPLPLKKSVLCEIEQKYSDEVSRTRASRFRATTDIAIPSMFAQYYAISTGRAVEWPNIKNEYVYLDTGREDAPERYRRILAKGPKFFCLNATRHNDIDLASQAKNLNGFLAAMFPTPAPWEAGDD